VNPILFCIWPYVCWSIALAALSPAQAHDLDCRGNPVPAHIKIGCCGAGDALQLQPGQWRGDDDRGYEVLIDGAWRPVVHTQPIPGSQVRVVEKIKALPSDDGCEWVWYRRKDTKAGLWLSRFGDGPYNFYCLQLNMGF